MDLASWTLGLSLIVLTIAIHTTGVVLMAFGLESRVRVRVDTHELNRLRAIPIVIGHIGAVALILAALHGVEGILWASAYRWLGAFDSFTDASVYSLGTMTTFELPGLALPPRGQMVGALEAVNGVLLFGISTAFIFAVMQVYWSMLFRRDGKRHEMRHRHGRDTKASVARRRTAPPSCDRRHQSISPSRSLGAPICPCGQFGHT